MGFPGVPGCARFEALAIFRTGHLSLATLSFLISRTIVEPFLRARLGGKKIHFSPHVVCCSCCLGEDPAVPMFKRRGLALDEGELAFFSGLCILLPQVAKKKKEAPGLASL